MINIKGMLSGVQVAFFISNVKTIVRFVKLLIDIFYHFDLCHDRRNGFCSATSSFSSVLLFITILFVTLTDTRQPNFCSSSLLSNSKERIWVKVIPSDLNFYFMNLCLKNLIEILIMCQLSSLIIIEYFSTSVTFSFQLCH